MISFKSLFVNLAKRARGPEGPVAAISQNRRPFAARLEGAARDGCEMAAMRDGCEMAAMRDGCEIAAMRDGCEKNQSALNYLLDYIVRTDTIPEKSALKIIKMIDNRDFPMDYVGGIEPPLDYEEILQQEREELEK